jgi:hypothetical protein
LERLEREAAGGQGPNKDVGGEPDPDSD